MWNVLLLAAAGHALLSPGSKGQTLTSAPSHATAGASAIRSRNHLARRFIPTIQQILRRQGPSALRPRLQTGFARAEQAILSARQRNPPAAFLQSGLPLAAPEPVIGRIAADADRYILRALPTTRLPNGSAEVRIIVTNAVQRAAVHADRGRLDVQFDPWNGILEVGWTRPIGLIKAGRRKFNLYVYIGASATAIYACYLGSEAGFSRCLTDALQKLFPSASDPRRRL